MPQFALDIIENPPSGWMERLRRNHEVWLVKEQERAYIEFPYEPPEPGTRCGRVGLRRAGQFFTLQSWFIGRDGEGINGSQLMLPVEGNLPENPEPLPEPFARQMQREIEHLRVRIEAVERRMGPFFDEDLLG